MVVVILNVVFGGFECFCRERHERSIAVAKYFSAGGGLIKQSFGLCIRGVERVWVNAMKRLGRLVVVILLPHDLVGRF